MPRRQFKIEVKVKLKLHKNDQNMILKYEPN